MIYNQKLLLLVIIFWGSVLSISCEEKTEYERRIETELGKNIRADSLFLGYHFGMTSDEFFRHSWDLNRQEIVTGQETIHYRIEGLKSPASMEFYPQFKDDKIYKMPLEVHYDGWAPWNRDLFADSLALELVQLYEQEYGADFFKSALPERGIEAYIDIQGNRRITIYENDDRIVNVEFLDLSTVENLL